MFVLVRHQVTDPQKFFADPAGVASNAPQGVHGRIFCPASDHSSAVCLWEAESIQAVRSYLNPLTEGISENTYSRVDHQLAIGLPDSVMATI